MVWAVEKSKVERMRRRSRMCQLQDLQMEDMCSLKERLLSKRTPRLRADEVGVIVVLELI